MNLSNKFFKRLIAQPLIVNTLKLSSSNILLYVLPLAVTPILSRMYNPSAFGEWGIFASVFTIISVGMLGSYENAIVKSTDDNVSPLCMLCLIIGLIVTVLTAIVFEAASCIGISFFAEFSYKSLLYVYMLFHVVTVVLTNLYNRAECYTSLSLSNVVIGGSQAVFRICWGVLLWFRNGLIVGTVCAQALGLAYLIIIRKGALIRKESVVRIKAVAKVYANFPKYDAPALVCQFAALNMPVIILSLFFPKSDIGCYSMITQLLLVPISFIGAAMGKVYYQQISYRGRNERIIDKERIRATTLTVNKILICLSALPCLFIGLGGDKIVVLFLGERWAMAGTMILCLSMWSIPTILTEPLKSLFRVLEKQRQLFVIEMVYLVASIVPLWVMCVATWSLERILVIYAAICFVIRSYLYSRIVVLSGISITSLPKIGRVLILTALVLIVTRCLLLIIC